MGLDDLLDDSKNSIEDDMMDYNLLDNIRQDRMKIFAEQLELEQPLISKKSYHNMYSVERNFINSKAYHDKFERLPVNADVQQQLYIQAGKLLDFVDGQGEERMLAINARTGEFLVDNFEREGSIKGTGFNDKEYERLNDCEDGIILMHNHSLNGRPSAQDLISYLDDERIKISLILCHDGTMYGIYDVNPQFKEAYEMLLSEAKQKTNDIDDAKRLATSKLYILNEKLGKKHKLFTVEKL